MGEAKMIRTNINFPDELFTEGKKYSKKLNISFNKFVREATRRKLSSISKYLKTLNMSMEKMSDGH